MPNERGFTADPGLDTAAGHGHRVPCSASGQQGPAGHHERRRERLEQLLERGDPGVDATHIAVRNIVGDVTLTGTVPSYPQYLEAAAAARRVAGVTGVHNQLEVVLPEGDYRDDVKLATAANNALAQNVTVPDSVEATVEDGDITLTGTVSYGTERAAAEAAVAGVAGVRNVINGIEISYVLDPVDVDLHVQEALDRSAAVPDGSDVTADTKDGVITLTGHVRTWAEHDAVVGAALMARGVVDIRDELEVTG